MTVKKCSVCNTSWPESDLDDLGRCHNCRAGDPLPDLEPEKNEEARHCPICKTILPESELTGFDICRKCRSESGKTFRDVKEKRTKASKQLNLNLLEE